MHENNNYYHYHKTTYKRRIITANGEIIKNYPVDAYYKMGKAKTPSCPATLSRSCVPSQLFTINIFYDTLTGNSEIAVTRI